MNKLSLNQEKTQYICFWTPQRTNIPDSADIHTGEVTINDTPKILGILINQQLNWSTHIQD